MRPLTDTTPKPLLRRRRQAADRVASGKACGDSACARSWSTRRWLAGAVPAGARRRPPLGTAPALFVRRPGAAGNRRRHVERAAAAWRAIPSSPSTATSGRISTSRACRDEPQGDAHLVLVDNPPQHPRGDFALRDGRVESDGEHRLTFAGIGVYRADAVRQLARDHRRCRSAPPQSRRGSSWRRLLRAAMARGR